MESLLSRKILTELIETAKAGMKNSYAPYSGFHVGAAALTRDGHMFSGCNVENASYGGTVCAERTAILKAVSEGYRELTDIAIVCSGEDYPMPCGMCLQVMAEFMPAGCVHVVRGDEIKSLPLSELLPYAFHL